MRAVLTLPMPDADFDLENVTTALERTTWLPTPNQASEEWRDARILSMMLRLPDDTQQQLASAEKILIQVGFSVEGIVSLERAKTIVIRLFHEGGSVETIKTAVKSVAERLPVALAELNHGNPPELEKSIEIRHTNDGATIAKGSVVTPHTQRFRAYLRTVRKREERLLRWLSVGAVAFFLLGIAAFLFGGADPTWLLVRGYAERIASAIFVAILTLLVNLNFEHRDWKSLKTEVTWLFD